MSSGESAETQSARVSEPPTIPAHNPTPRCEEAGAIAASDVLDGALRVPPGRWLMLVERTPIMPNRQSLLIGEPAAGNRAVIAVVDDRYLLDLLHAAAPLDVFRQAELRFDGGMPLYEAPGTEPRDGTARCSRT